MLNSLDYACQCQIVVREFARKIHIIEDTHADEVSRR